MTSEVDLQNVSKANNFPSESSNVKTVNLLTAMNTHCAEQ